ncbi:uncharacterized protein BO80DRAFT_499067 [Aspergillus ibericus CBS 121593]|uniref:GPI inositol-deacylase n=1 Tax=Aspergillus ibericus CBS 121593 TaxID=1448316 RepID=A0A395HD46_9EURO|nr:hypothetical protein BO80DRAFT_499067 [Aspergillus ibericus CBS 121593]RAL05419.1 hypothetical protein BO80DRAFT_499067 [Aspergillus ibericus CBS 121593]
MSATSTAAPTESGTGVIAPPTGVLPDLTDPAKHYYLANLVVVIVGVTVSTLCLLVRIYTRMVIVRRWYLDDDGYSHAGLGVHEWNLELPEYHKTLQILLAGALTYIPALGFSKISLIILYYRLSDMQRKWRLTLWSITAFVITYMLVLECCFLFSCRPIAKAWHPALEGTCLSRAPIFLAGVVASIFTDVVLMGMPLPIVAKLKMASRKRVGLAGMFGLGGLSLVTSILRLSATIPMLMQDDETYLLGKMVLWINVEASLVIVTACIPCFRQVIRFHTSGSWSDSGGQVGRMSRGVRSDLLVMLDQPPRQRPSLRASSLFRRITSSTTSDTEIGDLKEDFWGPFGLSLLHEPAEPRIDFIFVHGLGGGSRKTWSKTPNRSHYWPKEWLPREPSFEHVRIHSFGYNANWRERGTSILTIHDFGQALLGDIHTSPLLGQNANQTPIVLVGHSMGGLVIKKALLLAKTNPTYSHIATRIHSLFFLATPHRGADMAKLLSTLLSLVRGKGSKPYVESLFPYSEVIQTINDQFRHSYEGIQLWSFFETQPTILGLVVDKWSTILELPGEQISHLDADHSNVCKFDDPTDSNYCRLRDAFATAVRSINASRLAIQNYSAIQDQEDQMGVISRFLGIVESPEIDYENNIGHRTEGSCSWLTDKDLFLRWLEGKQSPRCYWLRGEPASGKSTIAAYVIQYLEASGKECAYFFFKDGSAGKSQIASLLCSLAYQMAVTNQEIRERLIELCESNVVFDRKDERSIWRAIFTARILRARLSRPQYWVIDAMDECETCSPLFSFLASVEASFPLRVFFTSRPSLSIERLISSGRLTVTDDITRDDSLGDIKLFVEAQSIHFLTESEHERDELIKEIIERSNGNFLWTQLVVNKILDAVTAEQVSDILVSSPDEINELYASILRKVMSTPETGEIARGILRWTLCAFRPLHVDELQEALKLDIGKTLNQLGKTIGSICGNLITVDAKSRVMVAHQTVREYLYRQGDNAQFSIMETRDHAKIFGVCLAYLSSQGLKSPRSRRARPSPSSSAKQTPLARYAVVHFSDHLVRSSPSNPAHLTILSTLLMKSSLAWIEHVAMTQNVDPLIQAAKNIYLFLEHRAEFECLLGNEVQDVATWANDIVHLVAMFGHALLSSPGAIYYLLPAVCPKISAISRASRASHRRFQVIGLSRDQWEDRLCCIVTPGSRTLSVACQGAKLALGLSTSKICIYQEATFQEQAQLDHGEPVRRLSFASVDTFLASAGRRKICCWNTMTGEQLWSVPMQNEAIALSFGEDDTVLYVATKANTALLLDVKSGEEFDMFEFCDWEEEEIREHRYRRPPIYADFSPAQGLLGLSYRQRPVSFWGLEGYEYEGQFHRSRLLYPEPLIVAFVFNPNPDIPLAAVSFQDGVTIVFDPVSLTMQATADTDASVLSVSPDGTILAAGTGNGIIKLYDFETLSFLKQVFLQQENIRALAFNSTGTRLFDVRGDYCNVWQPSALLQRPSLGDSGFDISETDQDPTMVEDVAWLDDLEISAMAAHHKGEYVFCGRENGQVAVYRIKTGQPTQELFIQTQNVAIDFLAWNSAQNVLACIDRGRRVTARRVVQQQQGLFEIEGVSLNEDVKSRPLQLLMNSDGSKLLIAMTESHAVWDLHSGRLVQEYPCDKTSPPGKWVSDPQGERLMHIQERSVHTFSWTTFERLSVSTYEISGANKDGYTISEALCPLHSHGIHMISKSNATPTFHTLAYKPCPSETESSSHHTAYERSLADYKYLLGVHRDRLIFLQHSGWVCSISLETAATDKFYTRHFFVPLPWHSAVAIAPVTITSQGTVIICVRHELAVFHNGLDYEEQVSL